MYNKVRKILNIGLSIANTLILIINIYYLCNNYPNTECLGIDYNGMLIGILSILVTLLIGWQILNYFQIEKKFECLVNEKIEKFGEDCKYVLNGIVRINIYNNAMSGSCAFLLDNCFSGLREIKKCKKDILKGFALDNVMELINEIIEHYDHIEIYKSTRAEYLFEIKDVESRYTNHIKEKLEKAKEIEMEEKSINTVNPISCKEIDDTIK